MIPSRRLRAALAALVAAAGLGVLGAAADPAQAPCHGTPAPADAPRLLVVGHPYDAFRHPVSRYAVWRLDADGSLTPRGDHFALAGRATFGHVVFTPDGRLGVVRQDDGTLGIFRVGDDGAVTVIRPVWSPGVHVSRVAMAPDGDRLLVLDGGWPGQGGGVYEVALACDGTPGPATRILEAQGARAIVPVPGRPHRAVLVARGLSGAPAGDDVALLSWLRPPIRLASADAFGDDDAIVSAAALTPDGRWLLVADDNGFPRQPNRVAVVGLTGDVLTPAQVLSPVRDPVDLAVAPDGRTVLVSSGLGNALVVLRRTGDPSAPFVLDGQMAFRGARPRMPGPMVQVTRGALAGTVIVGENTALRRLRFVAGGGVVDLGPTSTGTGTGAIVGALGLQP